MAMVLASECSACSCEDSAWKVELARYIHFPVFEGSNGKRNGCGFAKQDRSGTWISSKGSALLSVSQTVQNDWKLYVKIRGENFEEHFLSNLKFTWPQTRCRANCGFAGTRVVFASFCQKSCLKGHEKGKFALRFNSAAHAGNFLCRVQEISGIIPLRAEDRPLSLITSGTSCMSLNVSGPSTYDSRIDSQLLTSNGSTADNEKDLQDALSNGHHEIAVINHETFQSAEFAPTSSFLSLLQNGYGCSFPADTAQALASLETTREKSANDPDNKSHSSDKSKRYLADVKAEMMTFLKDPSFQEFFANVEKAWMEIEEEIMVGYVGARKK